MTSANNSTRHTGTVWITGASAGIGEAVARGLAQEGWQVAISARSQDRLQALERDHERLHAFPVDVTDAGALARCAAAVERRLGPIDRALFNAGGYRPMPVEDFDAALFAELMAVNFLGVVNGIAAVLPGMRARGAGRIYATGSVSGYSGLPMAAPYGATKAALINLCESLQAELGGSGVSVHVINPGFVKTRLTDQNEFQMPAIIDTAQAARRILHGMRSNAFEIAFPRRLAWVLKFLRILPYPLYFPLIRRMTGR